MRLLDRYIFFAFCKSFVAALIAFSIVSVMFDYFGRIGFLNDAKRAARRA